jgi:hypothetical protein
MSKRSSQGGSTDFRVDLHEPLKNVTSARLVQVVIPNSSPNIRQGSKVKYTILQEADLEFKLFYDIVDGVKLEYEDDRGGVPVFYQGATHRIRIVGSGLSAQITKDSKVVISGTGYQGEYFSTGVLAYVPDESVGAAVSVTMFEGDEHVEKGSVFAHVMSHRYSVDLPRGVYSGISFISLLSELLQEDGQAGDIADPWSVKFLSAENKFAIRPTLQPSFFSLFFDKETPGTFMGFTDGVHVGGTEAVSDKSPYMGGTLCVKIHIPEFHNTSHTFAVGEPQPFSFCIPASANLGDVIITDPQQLSHTKIDFNPIIRDLPRLTVQVMDDDGQIMDIDGQDLYLCMECISVTGFV